MDIKDVEAIYPLSPLQEAVLSNDIRWGDTGGGCTLWGCVLSGPLDVPAFTRAWQQAVSKHQVLRTFFAWENLDKPVQVVDKRLKLSPAHQDWRELDAAAQSGRLRDLLRSEREHGVVLSEAPLLRLTLCRTAEDEHHLVWSYHPLVLDEWSAQIVLGEVFADYENACHGQAPLPEHSRSYRDYIGWLRQQSATQEEAFWRESLKGFTAPTPLAVEQVAGAAMIAEPEYGQRQLSLSPASTARLQSLAREHRLSLSSLVRGAMAILLSRYSDEQDVVFGAAVTGRPSDLPGAESLVGPFMQTLPVRVSVPPGAAVLPWLQELEARYAEVCRYQHNSLTQIQKWSDVPEGLPLFESGIVVDEEAAALFAPGVYAGIGVHDIQTYWRRSLPLTLRARFNPELALQMAYDVRRFYDGTITRILEHLQTILEGMAARPEQRLWEVPLLTEAERLQILVEPNDTKIGYPQDQCVHWLFEAQAEQTPDIDAVVFNNDRLSYRELNERANRLAHYLQSLGVGPEVRVGVCIERSLEMLVGIVGTLKAGGAYVPLDPSYPSDRLAFMLKDAKASVLLTQESLVEGLPAHDGKVVRLDADWDEIAQFSGENPAGGVGGANLAYVIYTSGSTGAPKGVMVTHRGICNTSDVMVRVYDFPPGTRMLQFASLSFDMAVYDIIPAIISGATLCLAPQNPVMGADLVRLVREQAIQVLTLPPSVLATMPAEELPELQFVRVAGEAISADLAALWSPGRRFYNAYGPAEASVWVTGAFLDGSSNPVIGRPISNTQVYLLDSHQLPVPVGVPGELCIGGISVSRGYLNRPGTTAERFIPDPFSDEPGMRLYRTGDLARYAPNGDLEFLGRTDHQVKLHGVRIELGEIESLLRKHPAVKEAVALLREDAPGDQRLVAYVLSGGPHPPTPHELRSFLAAKLPHAMLPSAFVHLDSLPLTPNGKLDRRALPAPEAGGSAEAAEYVAPRDEVEAGLARIWGEVLGRERVGVHDNFFDLGGHSLLATQVVSRVREVFRVELPLAKLFDALTIEKISELIKDSKKSPGDNPADPRPALVPTPRNAHRVKSSILYKTGGSFIGD